MKCIELSIIGEKPDSERFPGAITTVSLEAMMQDGKALQAGTSHYLGQNFAQAQSIRFLDSQGEMQFAHTTSWGVSTRLIGGMIMTHGDDDGMRVPPRVAPNHVVVIPVVPKSEHEESVFAACQELVKSLSQVQYHGAALRVTFDKRDIRGGEKSWQWIKKGIPLRIEIGPRDLAERKSVLFRRDKGAKDKEFLSVDTLANLIPSLLDEIQQNYYDQALELQQSRTNSSITSVLEFREYFSDEGVGNKSGFVRVPWCGDEDCFDGLLDELKVTIRCIPLEQSQSLGTCVFTGKQAKFEAIFARAY